MNINFVDLKRQYQSIKIEIDNAISSVINNTSFILGNEVNSFENDFANLHGVKHCISVANGTDSLFIILKSLGIGENDEVITVCNSWISSSETISLTGAKAVFIDINKESFLMDLNKIEKAISSKTKAIMPVHMFGNPCDMTAIQKIASKHNLFIIEDCAQAHLAEHENKFVGTFGNAASYSFFPGKNLGAYGDAGGILTNDSDLALKCRMFARHGALEKHNHLIEGINSRMDNIQAAVLNVKLKYLKNWTIKRRDVAKLYDNLLKNLPLNLVKTNKGSKSSYHLYVIECDNRDALKLFLEKSGISCAIHYPKIIPLQTAYSRYGYKKDDFPVGSLMQERILSLPIFPEMKKEETVYVVDKIKEFFNKS